jgi:hypothetical protein
VALPSEITIEEFAKIDLRSAKVLAAEAVPKTDKLLKLVLDLGSEQRTVISGIAGATVLYLRQPEACQDLVGSHGLAAGGDVLYLANLKARQDPRRDFPRHDPGRKA